MQTLAELLRFGFPIKLKVSQDEEGDWLESLPGAKQSGADTPRRAFSEQT